MKGRKEDGRGEGKRAGGKEGGGSEYRHHIASHPYMQFSASLHCQGLKETSRPVLVGGEIFHPPVNIWCPPWSLCSCGPRWWRGWGAWRSMRVPLITALTPIAGSSVSQVADNDCQMVSLWSNKLPQNKEASQALGKAAVWTKHTSLEKIKSSWATEQRTSTGNATG